MLLEGISYPSLAFQLSPIVCLEFVGNWVIVSASIHMQASYRDFVHVDCFGLYLDSGWPRVGQLWLVQDRGAWKPCS